MGVINLDARVKKLEQDSGGGAVIDQLEAAVTALEEQINGDGETDLGLAGDVAALEDDVEALKTYSTTEHVVGEWIDGKPLYQKTVYQSDVAYSTVNTEYTLMSLPEDVDKVVYVSGLISTSNKYYYHSSPYVAPGTTIKISYIDVNLNEKKIVFISGDTWSSTDIIATVQYTKTESV